MALASKGIVTLACLIVIGIAAGSAGRAQADEEAVIQAAIRLCLSEPTDVEEVREALLASGWSRSNRNDVPDNLQEQTTALETIVGAYTAFNFRDNDLEYTFDNSYFRAISILGNSSLGSNQIGLVFGDVRLAVLGVEEGFGYCTMTGPSSLYVLGQRAGLQDMLRHRADIVDQRLGFVTGGLFQMGIIDIDRLKRKINNYPSIQNKDGYETWIEEIVMPISVSIYPKTTLEKWENQ